MSASNPIGTLSTGLTTERLGQGRMPGPVRIELDGIIIESTDALDLAVARLTFASGSATDWQSHPGPIFVVVTRGSLTRYATDDCSAETYASGTAFVEYGSNDGSIVRNEGPLEAAAIVTSVAPRRTSIDGVPPSRPPEHERMR